MESRGPAGSAAGSDQHRPHGRDRESLGRRVQVTAAPGKPCARQGPARPRTFSSTARPLGAGRPFPTGPLGELGGPLWLAGPAAGPCSLCPLHVSGLRLPEPSGKDGPGWWWGASPLRAPGPCSRGGAPSGKAPSLLWLPDHPGSSPTVSALVSDPRHEAAQHCPEGDRDSTASSEWGAAARPAPRFKSFGRHPLSRLTRAHSCTVLPAWFSDKRAG